MSILFTIHIVTVSYQCNFYSCYWDIHLLMFISCYCTSIYNKYVILIFFISNLHKAMLISQMIITKPFLYHKFRINSFVTFSNTIVCCRQLNLPNSKSFDCPYAANIERCPHRNHWKTELYWGLADCGEVDRDSDLNCLASVILRDYTTVTN